MTEKDQFVEEAGIRYSLEDILGEKALGSNDIGKRAKAMAFFENAIVKYTGLNPKEIVGDYSDTKRVANARDLISQHAMERSRGFYRGNLDALLDALGNEGLFNVALNMDPERVEGHEDVSEVVGKFRKIKSILDEIKEKKGYTEESKELAVELAGDYVRSTFRDGMEADPNRKYVSDASLEKTAKFYSAIVGSNHSIGQQILKEYAGKLGESLQEIGVEKVANYTKAVFRNGKADDDKADAHMKLLYGIVNSSA